MLKITAQLSQSSLISINNMRNKINNKTKNKKVLFFVTQS